MESRTVDRCRICRSSRVSDAGVDRRFYLANLDIEVDMPYAVCADCHYLFQTEYLGDDFLDRYYADSPMRRTIDDSPEEVRQFERQASFVARSIDVKDLNVLEVGAASGGFIDYLAREHGCNVFHHELSDEARKVLGLRQRLQDLDALPVAADLDLVVLRHVLEHVDRPVEFVKACTARLKPGGWLFVEVPDWNWLDSDTDPLIFEHLSQFTTPNVVNLMRDAGFVCEALEKSIVAEDPATPNRVQRFMFSQSGLPLPGDERIVSAVRDYYETTWGHAVRAINDVVETLQLANQRIAVAPASHLSFAMIKDSILRDCELVGFLDTDPKKQGTTAMGLSVFGYEAVAELDVETVFVFSMAYEPEIRRNLLRVRDSLPVFGFQDIKGELVQEGPVLRPSNSRCGDGTEE